MKKILQMASAFIGIIIGAGFASGQEILQYFVSFGYLGIVAAILASALFAFMGMTLTKLGSKTHATSHSDVIYNISGRFLGRLIDYILIIALFGFGVVMIAGSGSTFHQQFGFPPLLGSGLMIIFIMISVSGHVERVVKVIGSITPFLIASVLFLGIYSIVTKDLSFAQLHQLTMEQKPAVSNWFISTLNYVSMNIVLGASMTIVMGGDEKNEKTAALGGLFGGLGIGVLILISYFTIFSKIDVVGHVDMPLLKVADELSPILGMIYSIILYGMIFNTTLSLFYSLGARFAEIGTKKFKMFIFIMAVLALLLSFAGFTKLVSLLYPLIGYMGFVLCAILAFSWIQVPNISKAES